MDKFSVRAKDTSVLDRSHLVAEIKADAWGREMFPVLVGEHVAYFHDVEGGYDRERDYHVVNFIHRVQGPDSPPNKEYAPTIEAHLDKYYSMEVEDFWKFGEYPDEDLTLSYKVSDYKIGPYSFSEALSEEIDGREQEFSPD